MSPRGLLAVGCALVALATPLAAQVPAEPELRGRLLVGDTPTSGATVTLHRVSTDEQGEIDSVRTAADGTFSFLLPNVPAPDRGDVYFASVRYSGVLYFGQPIRLAVQLDSLYEITAFDTVSVALQGRTLPVQVRNTFLEPQDGAWKVTDLLEVRNDGQRTLVAREGGAVWRYPLARGSHDHTVGQGGLSADGVDFEGEEVVVSSPLPPGERLVVVQYMVDDPFITLPAPGETEAMELLVREPAPVLVTPLLSPAESLELEPGSTYRRLSGASLSDTVITLEEGTSPSRFPVEWIAVLLALVLTGFGVAALSKAGPTLDASPKDSPDSRASLLLEIARMDEAFAALEDPPAAERVAYERRRKELFRRIRTLG